MTEMLILQARLTNPDAIMRLSEDLTAAHARGQDLGPRAPHIQAVGECLAALGNQLEFAVCDLKALLGELGLQDRSEGFRPLLDMIHELAGKAKAFPATS